MKFYQTEIPSSWHPVLADRRFGPVSELLLTIELTKVTDINRGFGFKNGRLFFEKSKRSHLHFTKTGV